MNKEDLLQQKIFIWYKNNYQINGNGYIFSVPNGSTRNIVEAIKLKETGLVAGVSDLIVLFPNGKTIFVELKIEKGIQSKVQKDFETKVSSLGFKYFIIRSLNEFITLCKHEQQKTENYLDFPALKIETELG